MTYRLGGDCSILLSYEGVKLRYCPCIEAKMLRRFGEFGVTCKLHWCTSPQILLHSAVLGKIAPFPANPAFTWP